VGQVQTEKELGGEGNSFKRSEGTEIRTKRKIMVRLSGGGCAGG